MLKETEFDPPAIMFRLKRGKLFYFLWFIAICSAIFLLPYFPSLRSGRRESLVITDLRLSNEIQSRLRLLETGLKENRLVLDEIRSRIEHFTDQLNEKQDSRLAKHTLMPKTFGKCSNESYNSRFDLTIEKIFSTIQFDNPDGGSWKQGWEVKYDPLQWNSTKKLKVFVVPHSHNDPGWIKTFDQYFKEQTRHILNNLLKKLPENPNMSFIWAETSFFSAWWNILQSEDGKEAIKTLLDNGQLEIVTGGWVMNDEATTHYSAMIAQMVDGHEFLKHNLNYTPRYGWAIDPFGASPTMAFLLKKMGFKGMVIQRVHYSIKKYLAQHKMLEFNWRQFWESSQNTGSDIMCHIEPFYSYDIPHTCGPDPKICCQFDFKRLPYTRIGCPWKVPPQKISALNIAERVATLVDQYKKKASLYRVNSLLVPLGDDFRWDKLSEWENQYSNYQALFDYINSHEEIGVEIKWGTLRSYFETLEKESLPTFSGDFFTYADRDDDYWSGFYTTRPFHKSMERSLESYVRSAEILFSIGCVTNEIDQHTREKLSKSLNYARLNLDIFQHHDGITGTSKNNVVNDYSTRLFNSIQKCQEIIVTITSLLLRLPDDNLVTPIHTMEIIPNHYSLPLEDVLPLNQDQRSYVTIYNSLGMQRDELVCLAIPTSMQKFIIRHPNGKMLDDVQINQIYDAHQLRDDVHEACFLARLQPLSLSQYTIEKASDDRLSYSKSNTTIYDNNVGITPSYLEISTDKVKLMFDGQDGSLWKVHLHSDDRFKSIDLKTQFMTYQTRKEKSKEKSGAYLFLPEPGEAEGVSFDRPYIRITTGPVMSKYEVLIDNSLTLHHQVIVAKGQDFFDMKNEFQMTKGPFDNKELLMRFLTNIESSSIFYTDLNSLQMVRRKWYDKIPLQGNVYPLPSLTYIEDNWTRLNVLSAQPLGVTSRHKGQLDVFLDRRLMQDDQRGVGQGITDNRRTRESFRIVIERKPEESLKPSVQVQRNLLRLLNPPHLISSKTPSQQGELVFMPKELPCDIHLLNLRTNIASYHQFSLFLHRFATSCDSSCTSYSASFPLASHLSPTILNALQPSVSILSLSLMDELERNVSLSSLKVEMDQIDFVVYALRLK